MIKHTLTQIASVENYGIVSLCLFFAFFSGALIWAFRLSREHTDHMSQLPLSSDLDPLSTPAARTNHD